MHTTRSIRGLGFQLAPDALRQLGEDNMEMFAKIRSNIAKQAGAPPSAAGNGAGAPDVPKECPCLARQLAQFTGGGEDTVAEYVAVCAARGPAAFVSDANAELAGSPARGSTISLDPCIPWYKRKTTWLYGGAGLLGLAVLWKMTR